MDDSSEPKDDGGDVAFVGAGSNAQVYIPAGTKEMPVEYLVERAELKLGQLDDAASPEPQRTLRQVYDRMCVYALRLSPGSSRC